jgi:hypothetical protein
MKSPAVDIDTNCKIHTGICFLHAKNMNAEEIHPELSLVYGQNVMSDRTVWHCQQTKVHVKE